jgi:hypothetical protein
MSERAFPGYDVYGDGKAALAGHPHGGMTLRDYFAAKALVLMQNELIREHVDETYPGEPSRVAYAMWAYAVADAMLRAREQR